MNKLLLLLAVAFSTMLPLAAQTQGTDCNTPIPAVAGNNNYTYDAANYYQYFSYTESQNDRMITISTCGVSAESYAQLYYMFKGNCQTYFSDYTSTSCGSNGHSYTFKAKAGEKYIFEWYGYANFTWQLKDEAMPFGLSSSNPIKAFEGKNNTVPWDTETKSIWYEYTFPADGAVTIGNCNYQQQNASFYVYSGVPTNQYNDSNDLVYSDPKLLSFGSGNCGNYNSSSKVNVNGTKGDKILIQYYFDYQYYNNFDWDLAFTPSKWPVGTDSKNPAVMEIGSKNYTLQNPLEDSYFSYFNFTPTKTATYKITLNSNVNNWSIWDKAGVNNEKQTNKSVYINGIIGVPYWFGLYANTGYNQGAVDVNITLAETADIIPNPCGTNIYVSPNVVTPTNLASNPNYAFIAPADGEFAAVLMSGKSQYLEVSKECSRKNRIDSYEVYPELNTYHHYYPVKAGDTVYFSWDERQPIFSWKIQFYNLTDIKSFSIEGQTGPAIIDNIKHEIKVELSASGDSSSVYTSFNLPSGVYAYINSSYVSSGTNIDFSGGNVTMNLQDYLSTSLVDWKIYVTKASSLYSGNSISSISVNGQMAPPVISGTNITATVEWRKYGNHDLYLQLSPGASTYDNYVYFYDDSTTVTKVLTIYAEDGSTKAYNLKLSRSVPVGASCTTAIVAKTGLNQNAAWKAGYTFKYTAVGNNAIKISGTNAEASVYYKDCCGGACSQNYLGYVDFGAPVYIKVQAGSTYYFWFDYNDVSSFNIEEIPLLSGNEITSAYVSGEVSKTISIANRTVTLWVPLDSQTQHTYVDIESSPGATATYDGEIVNYNIYHNFDSIPTANIQVTAMNGSVANWKIEVLKLQPSAYTGFSAFVLKEQIAPATIDIVNHKVSVLVSSSTDVSMLIPAFILDEGSDATTGVDTMQYSGRTMNNFTNPVIYHIKNYYNQLSQDWTVSVIKAKTTDAEVLGFNLHGQTGTAQINPKNATINITVKDFVSKAAMITYLNLSPGASAKIGTIAVTDGSAQNFTTSPVDMVVTAADKTTTKTWKVSVNQLVPGVCNADFTFVAGLNGVTFMNTASGSSLNAVWDFGDGTSATSFNAAHAYKVAGTYNVTLSVSNSDGCSSKKTQAVVVTVVNPVFADFSFTSSATSDTVKFTNLSTGATSYIWTFDDGNYSKEVSPTYVYDYPGYYYVCLQATAANGAGSTSCKEITAGDINCDVDAWFGYTVNDDTKTVTFADSSYGTYDAHFWNFGDGKTSTQANPSHTYAKAGYYEVSLSVKKSGTTCFDTYYDYILVGTADCKASFTSIVNPALKTVDFTSTSKGNIAYYYWDFGDGTYSEEQNPSVTFENGGVQYVSLTVADETGNCIDYTYEAVEVGEALCNAQFTYFTDVPTLTLYLNSESKDASNQYLWVMGDGTTSVVKNPVHKFKFGGYYNILLTTFNFENACMDYYEELVLVGDAGIDCEADFAYTPNALTVNFTDKSKGDILFYAWNFGEDENANAYTATPTHTYNVGGYYDVCLAVLNSSFIPNITCKTIAVDLNESNNCKADFSYVVDSISRTASFVDKSIGKPTSWEWDFGDNETANSANPSHTYAVKDYYLAYLKTTNAAGCKSSAYKLLNVGEAQAGLKVKFVAEVGTTQTKAGGYPVDLSGAGLGDEARLKWDFGDGSAPDTTSTSPTHNYAPGTYNVCYEATDPITGASDKYCQDVVVTGTNVEGVSINNRLNAYPVPMASNLNIQFYLTGSAKATVEIVDLMGKRVALVAQQSFTQGVNSLVFNTSGIKNGSYILRVLSEGEVPAAIMITK